jgi:iron complex outermembrane recepter protein
VNPTISIVDDTPNDYNYAVYANAQFDIFHNLELSIAGRYDIEKKTDTESAPDMINPLTGANYNLCILALGPPLSHCSEHETFDKFTPKVSLTYKTQFGNIYASYGEGFKSGGYNPIGTRTSTLAAAAAAGQPTSDIYVQDAYKPETSETYEVGVKTHFFENRLTINLAGYHTLLDNEQEFVFFPTAGIQAIQSIDKVRLIGFDSDFALALPDNIELTGAYGYNHGTITSYLANPSYDGNTAPLALKYTVNFAAAQTIPVGERATLTPRLEFQRQGPIFWDAANTPGTERDPINLVNGTLAWKKGTWQTTVWSKNMFDKRYNSEFVPLAGLLSVVYKGDPRSFGLNVAHEFK